ncbi:MAG: hypothetical protein QW728_01980, partial [Thermoplasmata archaeon]
YFLKTQVYSEIGVKTAGMKAWKVISGNASGAGNQGFYVAVWKYVIHFSSSGNEVWKTEVANDIWDMAFAGDTNNDGKSEIIGVNQDGEVFLLDGSNGRQIYRITVAEPYVDKDSMQTETIKRNLWNLALLNDIDSDGLDDFSVSSEDCYVYAISTRTGSVIWKQKVQNQYPLNEQTCYYDDFFLNIRVFPVNDFDRDGLKDVGVSVKGMSQGGPFGTGTPRVLVLSSKKDLTGNSDDLRGPRIIKEINFPTGYLPIANPFISSVDNDTEPELLYLAGSSLKTAYSSLNYTIETLGGDNRDFYALKWVGNCVIISPFRHFSSSSGVIECRDMTTNTSLWSLTSKNNRVVLVNTDVIVVARQSSESKYGSEQWFIKELLAYRRSEGKLLLSRESGQVMKIILAEEACDINGDGRNELLLQERPLMFYDSYNHTPSDSLYNISLNTSSFVLDSITGNTLVNITRIPVLRNRELPEPDRYAEWNINDNRIQKVNPAGDLTGDGRDDILCIMYDGSLAFLNPSTGVFFAH